MLFTDDFNRADSDTVGTPWVERVGDWDIIGNAVTRTDGTGAGQLIYDQVIDADHWVEATISQDSGAGSVGLIVRAAASGPACIIFGIINFRYRVIQVFASGDTNTLFIGDEAGHSAGQRLRAETEGNVLRFFVNDIQVSSFTTSVSAGNTRVGLYAQANANAVRYDDFEAGDFAVAPPEGSASGAIAWAGSVSGEMSPEASVSGAIAWAGSVDGQMLPEGSASGAIAWAGSVNGQMLPEGSVSGAIVWAGSVNGEMLPEGSVSGAIVWAGTAVGETSESEERSGSASGAIVWAGSVLGEMDPQGHVIGVITWHGSVTSLAIFDPELFLEKPHVTGHKPKVISSRKPRIIDGYKPVVTLGKDGG